MSSFFTVFLLVSNLRTGLAISALTINVSPSKLPLLLLVGESALGLLLVLYAALEVNVELAAAREDERASAAVWEASSAVSVMGVPLGAETATSSPIDESGIGAVIRYEHKAEKSTEVWVRTGAGEACEDGCCADELGG